MGDKIIEFIYQRSLQKRPPPKKKQNNAFVLDLPTRIKLQHENS